MGAKSDKHHIVPLKTYLAVGFALLVLTAVTIGVSFIDLGGWNAIVAVAIASIKALMVAFIFMHLLYDKKIFLVIFSVAILFLTIFISFTMFDILSRNDIYPGLDKPISSDAIIYDRSVSDTTDSNNIVPDTGGVKTTH